MPKIDRCEPYRAGEMGSFGTANGMLIAQHNFPVRDYDLSQGDFMSTEHDDRFYERDCERCNRVTKKHTGSGNLNLEQWFLSATPESILAYLKDLTQIDREYTGYRILGYVNRSNGFPVYALQMFQKGRKSKTVVESKNVIGEQWAKSRRIMDEKIQGRVNEFSRSCESDVGEEYN